MIYEYRLASFNSKEKDAKTGISKALTGIAKEGWRVVNTVMNVDLIVFTLERPARDQFVTPSTPADQI